jgi:hypothetical protein
MDGSNEHNRRGGDVAVIGSPRSGGTPSSATVAGKPGPSRSRPTLATTAAVCVIAASLSVVGWIHSTGRESVSEGGRYAVVETPPEIRASPQPLVPLLPPDPATDRHPRTSTRPSKVATPRRATPAVTGPVGAISGYAGKCLHVPDGEVVDGIPVEMTSCDGSRGEQWTMASDGTIRALGKCLGVVGDQVADGTRVQVGACRGAQGQRWRFTAGRDLTNPHADKCLDVKDFNPLDGASLQLWTCTGSVNQKWSRPA